MSLLQYVTLAFTIQSILIAQNKVLEKNTFTKINLKYIYFMLSILQIHLYIYVPNKNTLRLYFWYTKIIVLYLKFAKQLHFVCNANVLCGSSAEAQLKTCWSVFDCAKVKLLQVYWRYTLNILHLKTDIITKIIQTSSIVILKHILGLILRNVHCAQVIKLYISNKIRSYNWTILVWTKCILNILLFFTREPIQHLFPLNALSNISDYGSKMGGKQQIYVDLNVLHKLMTWYATEHKERFSTASVERGKAL